MAHYQQIPKITVVFLGFPSSANVSAGAGPARTVVTELPATDPRAPRAPVMLDIIAKLKREHFANDHSIDLSRASVYRGPPDFSQIRPSSPLGMLSNGDFLLVVCSSLPKNLQTPNSAGTISQAARIPTQPPPRIQTRSLDTEPQYMDAISPWDQTPSTRSLRIITTSSSIPITRRI
ncbi:hypothetical protein BC829DRAFT_286919 [Chytridium lagenaria]|nr:hypothetical protein BC829DRAFT_286919 [Chytridium lagenaria]